MNYADDHDIAKALLTECAVTWPCILDTSREAWQAQEKLKNVAVPQNYIIDREGKIVDGWCGNDFERADKALEKLGIEAGEGGQKAEQ